MRGIVRTKQGCPILPWHFRPVDVQTRTSRPQTMHLIEHGHRGPYPVLVLKWESTNLAYVCSMSSLMIAIPQLDGDD